MRKKNKPEKKCLCGRIITDPKNKTKLCPRCKKNSSYVVIPVGVAGALALMRKLIREHGEKAVKGAIDLARKLIS